MRRYLLAALALPRVVGAIPMPMAVGGQEEGLSSPRTGMGLRRESRRREQINKGGDLYARSQGTAHS
jgi:hypothetical protein